MGLLGCHGWITNKGHVFTFYQGTKRRFVTRHSERNALLWVWHSNKPCARTPAMPYFYLPFTSWQAPNLICCHVGKWISGAQSQDVWTHFLKNLLSKVTLTVRGTRLTIPTLKLEDILPAQNSREKFLRCSYPQTIEPLQCFVLPYETPCEVVQLLPLTKKTSAHLKYTKKLAKHLGVKAQHVFEDCAFLGFVRIRGESSDENLFPVPQCLLATNPSVPLFDKREDRLGGDFLGQFQEMFEPLLTNNNINFSKRLNIFM
eukprot:m.91880 g.91880  ORF g.91880 m.91880 type:complete len:259 (-) comp12340_c0_seq1:1303-2079(-)